MIRTSIISFYRFTFPSLKETEAESCAFCVSFFMLSDPKFFSFLGLQKLHYSCSNNHTLL